MVRRSAFFSRLVRAVLAWFALTLAVAFASPIVHQANLQAICNAGGGIKYVVMVDLDDHGGLTAQPDHASHDNQDSQGDPAQPLGHSHMDCPLCFVTKEPPPAEFDMQVLLASPLAHALTALASAEINARAGAPLPPRGPPTAGI